MSDVTKHSLVDEQWREYDFSGRVYRIDDPCDLYTRPGGTTHRVTTYDRPSDSIIVHCVPAPGHLGCVLRWRSRDQSKPISF